MNTYEHEFALIKKILQENPKGMTVTDISRKIKINRNSVAKYLDIMRISGHVEMITFGPAKVFFPSLSSSVSPMHIIGVNPASIAASTFLFTISLVSKKKVRLSECPKSTWLQPASLSISGDISPVNAPVFSQCMFWPAMRIFVPARSSPAS